MEDEQPEIVGYCQECGGAIIKSESTVYHNCEPFKAKDTHESNPG